MIDIKIEIINQLKDNYSYLLHNNNSLGIIVVGEVVSVAP